VRYDMYIYIYIYVIRRLKLNRNIFRILEYIRNGWMWYESFE